MVLANNGNQLSCDTLKTVLRNGIKDNGVIFDEEELFNMVEVLMVECDDNFNFSNIIKILDDYPELYESLSLKYEHFKLPNIVTNIINCSSPLCSFEDWIVPNSGNNVSDTVKKPFCHSLASKFLRRDTLFVFTILMTLGTLFLIRSLQHNHLVGVDGLPCYELMIAKGCGVAINATTTLMILLMTRPLITKIRMNFSNILPVDKHVEFHKYGGILLFILAVIHTVVHLVNIDKNFANGKYKAWASSNKLLIPDGKNMNFTYIEWLLTTEPGVNGFFPGLANPTGVLLCLTCVIIGIGANPKLRQKGHFEIFYWSHIFYVAFFALLILHCDQALLWLFIPLTLFFGGKIVMVKRWLDGTGKTYVICGTLLPSKVTQLTIRRPKGLEFHPGDWLFINIPTISTFEWHPFTISSAPEENEFLTLHIRSLGGWTNRLHQYFMEESRLMRLESKQANLKPNEVYKLSIKQRFIK